MLLLAVWVITPACLMQQVTWQWGCKAGEKRMGCMAAGGCMEGAASCVEADMLLGGQ
jgi:hypothetical protein